MLTAIRNAEVGEALRKAGEELPLAGEFAQQQQTRIRGVGAPNEVGHHEYTVSQQTPSLSMLSTLEDVKAYARLDGFWLQVW
jgi:hypothetical protein